MLSTTDCYPEKAQKERPASSSTQPLSLTLPPLPASLPPRQHSQYTYNPYVTAANPPAPYVPLLPSFAPPASYIPSNMNDNPVGPVQLPELVRPEGVYSLPQGLPASIPVIPDYLRQMLRDRFAQSAVPIPKFEPEIEAPVPEPLTPPPSCENDFQEPVVEDESDDSLDDEQEEEEDLEPIEPDHYFDGTVPVFKPTMEQFESFPKFIKRIDSYGMKTGIVKVIPPKEWADALPPITDEQIRKIKIKRPIVQHISGSGGIFAQTNIEKGRSYTLPQWRALSEESDHLPPARRGERRAGSTSHNDHPRKRTKLTTGAAAPADSDASSAITAATTSAEKKKRGELSAQELAEFENFDYRFDAAEFTDERCAELERIYWKTITYNNPLYGADLLGSLFTDQTKSWNVAKLDNLLSDLGKEVPGVNTAYLYFGMWKSTFAWHVEDMDLYSINYIHFGAPKQWYSISQADRAKFFNMMRNAFPTDYQECKEFLRHKTFNISPTFLKSKGIKVNKVVHRQNEFIITYPYGYHSGYNLGYNCAESVNFATESWLDIGRQAEYCKCLADSVGIDVPDLEARVKARKKAERSQRREERKRKEAESEAGGLDKGVL
ncbi:JmjC domain, hydroxylase-domain-containing protein [Myxozyma melibiosi]|uniref:JmjC domain, hydroxylase-domain-containing protein n=1 Tax=Myxozyma melibiosi TaxID=54550 RepID=A0ABR1F0R0_9ASCO